MFSELRSKIPMMALVTYVVVTVGAGFILLNHAPFDYRQVVTADSQKVKICVKRCEVSLTTQNNAASKSIQ